MTLTRFQVPYPSTSRILEACWIVGSVYGHCCLLRDFKNLGLLFCFIFYYYCHYSTLYYTFIYKRKKAITKAAKEIVQKELKENIIKLKHEKKDIGNGKICHKA